MMPLVLLPGWGFSTRVWASLRQELAEFRPATPELADAGSALAERADRLAETLATKSVLVGWSLGAMLALEAARRWPDRIAGLFLIGANTSFVRRSDWPHGLAPEIVSGFRDDFALAPERTLKRFLALQVLGDAQRKALQTQLAENLLPADADGLAEGLTLLQDADLRLAPGEISCPVRLLHGRQDALMPIGAAHALQAILPGARLIEIADAGHCPLFCDTPALANEIRSFVDEC